MGVRGQTCWVHGVGGIGLIEHWKLVLGGAGALVASCLVELRFACKTVGFHGLR